MRFLELAHANDVKDGDDRTEGEDVSRDGEERVGAVEGAVGDLIDGGESFEASGGEDGSSEEGLPGCRRWCFLFANEGLEVGRSESSERTHPILVSTRKARLRSIHKERRALEVPNCRSNSIKDLSHPISSHLHPTQKRGTETHDRPKSQPLDLLAIPPPLPPLLERKRPFDPLVDHRLLEPPLPPTECDRHLGERLGPFEVPLVAGKESAEEDKEE